jgi:DNA polymerase
MTQERPGGSPENYWGEIEALGWALLSQLEYFEALGLTALPWGTAPPAPGPPGPERGPESPAQLQRASPGPAAAGEAADLAALEALMAACQACPLSAGRPEPPAAGRGGARPLIWLVGPDPSVDAPGARELLTAMMEKGLALAPEDYYVSTLVRCRPSPDGRPGPENDRLCRPFLDRELTLLRPRLVLALGHIPAQRLSGSRDQLALLRARSFTLPGPEKIWLRATYGLEDILESQILKREAWKDLRRIKAGLGKL